MDYSAKHSAIIQVCTTSKVAQWYGTLVGEQGGHASRQPSHFSSGERTSTTDLSVCWDEILSDHHRDMQTFQNGGISSMTRSNLRWSCVIVTKNATAHNAGGTKETLSNFFEATVCSVYRMLDDIWVRNLRFVVQCKNVVRPRIKLISAIGSVVRRSYLDCTVTHTSWWSDLSQEGTWLFNPMPVTTYKQVFGVQLQSMISKMAVRWQMLGGESNEPLGKTYTVYRENWAELFGCYISYIKVEAKQQLVAHGNPSPRESWRSQVELIHRYNVRDVLKCLTDVAWFMCRLRQDTLLLVALPRLLQSLIYWSLSSFQIRYQCVFTRQNWLPLAGHVLLLYQHRPILNTSEGYSHATATHRSFSIESFISEQYRNLNRSFTFFWIEIIYLARLNVARACIHTSQCLSLPRLR